MAKPKIRAKKKMGGYEVMINITAPTEIVDGYLEVFYGMALMSGLLISKAEPCKEKVDEHNTMITQFFIFREPPLGSMGLDDIPDCNPPDKEN